MSLLKLEMNKAYKIAVIVLALFAIGLIVKELIETERGLERTAQNVLTLAQAMNGLAKRIEELEKK